MAAKDAGYAESNMLFRQIVKQKHIFIYIFIYFCLLTLRSDVWVIHRRGNTISHSILSTWQMDFIRHVFVAEYYFSIKKTLHALSNNSS